MMDKLSQYEIVKAIGKGSYGDVLLVRNKEDKTTLVLKKILLTNASAEHKDLTLREVTLLSGVHHPNIVQHVESFFHTEGRDEYLCILMEYCANGDLYNRIQTMKKTGKQLPEKQIIEWFFQILLAIQYIHRKRILHRDLKTQNIFLDSNNVIKLGDFGVARTLDGTREMAKTMIGTPFYMSPEIFEGKQYNYKSDLWALGCILFEMVTLRQAFDAKELSALMLKVIKGNAPSIPSTFSPQLAEIVRSLLNKVPAKRPNCSTLFKTPYMKKHAETNPVLKGILEQIAPSVPVPNADFTPPVTPRARDDVIKDEDRKKPIEEKKKKVSVGKSNTPARKDDTKEEKKEKSVKKVAATPQRTSSKTEKTEPAKNSEVKVEPKPKAKPALKLITKERSTSIGDASHSPATSSDVHVQPLGLGTPPTHHREVEQVAPAFSPRHRLQRSADAPSQNIVVESQPVVDSDSENNSEEDELDSDEDDEWGSDGDEQSQSDEYAFLSGGSLSERIRLITEECTAGLGREKFEKVKELMKSSEDEEDDLTMEKIRAVIGSRDIQKFTEKYSPLITQLIFCEEAV